MVVTPMSEIDYTTISVARDTKERLEAHGTKNETWDDLLRKLLDAYEGGPA